MFLSALFSVAVFHLWLCLISAKKTVRETEIDTDQIEKDLINKFYQWDESFITFSDDILRISK